MTHITDWPIRLTLTEDGTRTTARVEVLTRSYHPLAAEGVARRNPHDPVVPEIGQEIAAARALAELARQLLAAGADDLARLGEPPVAIRY